ncbi:MAG: hypothetical protein M1831_004007 [Alyxoria varia]|nr:MAG: hypothetical protein M1831_004007 [Alyxoria varia]
MDRRKKDPVKEQRRNSRSLLEHGRQRKQKTGSVSDEDLEIEAMGRLSPLKREKFSPNPLASRHQHNTLPNLYAFGQTQNVREAPRSATRDPGCAFPAQSNSAPLPPLPARPRPTIEPPNPEPVALMKRGGSSAHGKSSEQTTSSNRISVDAASRDGSTANGTSKTLRRKKSRSSKTSSSAKGHTLGSQSVSENPPAQWRDGTPSQSSARPVTEATPNNKPVQAITRSDDESQDHPPLPSCPPQKMHQLMRTTSGRMQGVILYRKNGSNQWFTAQCWTELEAGSLRCARSNSLGPPADIVPDLRGCQVYATYDPEIKTAVLQLIPRDETHSVQIRPENSAYFNAWFAALLCWQPVVPGHRLQTSTKQRRLIPSNIKSETTNIAGDKNPVIKVGKAMYVDPDIADPGSIVLYAGQNSGRHIVKSRWTKASTSLRSSGELFIKSLPDEALLATVQLSEYPRHAIQRIHSSVLDADCVIGLYPQYANSSKASSQIRPLCLSYDSRESFEIWFVLLKAFSMPEIFGAETTRSVEPMSSSEILPGISAQAAPDLFRLEKALHFRINEVKFSIREKLKSNHSHTSSISDTSKLKSTERANYYIEIMVDGQMKGKTSVKFDCVDPHWYESFEFLDFGSAMSSVVIRLKKQTWKRANMDAAISSPPSSRGSVSGPRSVNDNQPDYSDRICGEAAIDLDSMELNEDANLWLPVTNDQGISVGDISLRCRHDNEHILMEYEYEQLLELLRNFTNFLTLQIYERLPSELTRLATYLLNIFQISGQANEWLMSLIEEEVDGVRERESAAKKSRFDGRIESNESLESGGHSSRHHTAPRQYLVREMGKAAAAEINLLFRSNTLLSKALELHMRRLGQSYLEDVLGHKLREVAMDDTNYEVDPSRLKPVDDVDKNWHQLITLTSQIWDSIFLSVSKCPTELRMIFRHVQACANVRYGDFSRTVTYSSVTGFLFLRFFCAAILNPPLYGLINGFPKPRALRTFTLVAKSLQNLANMNTFGNKEPWMTPMNDFLTSHRSEFKSFVDSICAVSADERVYVPTSYSTPLTVYKRLCATSREGFPSLPHLIDGPRNLAALADLWLDNVTTSKSSGSDSSVPSFRDPTGDLARFHALCVGLRQRINHCITRAEYTDKTSSPLTHKWVAIAERIEVAPGDFWVRKPRRYNFAPAQGHNRVPSSKGEIEEPDPPPRNRAMSIPVASASVLQGYNEPHADDFARNRRMSRPRSTYSAEALDIVFDDPFARTTSRAGGPLGNKYFANGSRTDHDGGKDKKESTRKFGFFSRRAREERKRKKMEFNALQTV